MKRPHKPRTFTVSHGESFVYGFRCCKVSKWARTSSDRQKLIDAHLQTKVPKSLRLMHKMA